MASAAVTGSWHGRQFIAGRWRDAAVGHFENMNPANLDEVLGLYPRGTAADVDEAVQSARAAFPTWRRTSRIRRGELFINLANLIRRDTDELAAVLARKWQGSQRGACRSGRRPAHGRVRLRHSPAAHGSNRGLGNRRPRTCLCVASRAASWR